jgi:GNAT superfamily N-acetyltransferase
VGEREVRLSGLSYLEAVTGLLQRARRQEPHAGLWEAADLQWWWRRPRSSDRLDQRVVLDESDRPLATVALTDWGDRWSCEALVVADRAGDLRPRIWRRAVEELHRRRPAEVETSIRDDDPRMAQLAADSGFAPTSARYAETWLDAADRPSVPALRGGYTLSDRAEDIRRPHHLILRNGPDVAVRLAQTSLYRPDLDLCIRARRGEIAAYGLFWYDPVTDVGLVEPMRAEDDHQRLGLAGHLLRAGLARLAALGATRLKVSYELDNPAAERLYLSAGFRPGSTSGIWASRGPSPPPPPR